MGGSLFTLHNSQTNRSYTYFFPTTITWLLAPSNDLSPQKEAESYDLSRLSFVIMEVLPNNLQLLVKDMTLSSKVVFLLNSNCPDFSFYQNTIANIKKCMSEHSGLTISIGMGSLVDSYDLVSKSYMDSINSLDYRMIYGKNCLITPEMYKSHMPETPYPTTDITMLYTALLSRDEQNAFEVINRLNNYIKEAGCSLHTAKYICYNIFSILKKLPNKLKLEKCMQLLQETDMSMNEIGNTDVSGFIRFFKKNTNMTPGEYRKHHQKSKHWP